MVNSPISSSSESSELFFSVSEDSIDALLEEQDNIIDDLRKELEILKKSVKDDIVRVLRILNTLIDKVNKI